MEARANTLYLGGHWYVLDLFSGKVLAYKNRSKGVLRKRRHKLILAQLTLRLPISQLQSIIPGVKINKPVKQDYDPGLWKKMRHFDGAHVYEKIASRELYYQLGFMNGEMTSVQINTSASFTEGGYAALLAIGDQIVAANAERALTHEPTTAPVPWSGLKEERLAASGLPNDRYFICRSESWRNGQVRSYLNVALEWPEVLALEYREETHT